jgi:hypothetical protein
MDMPPKEKKPLTVSKLPVVVNFALKYLVIKS